MRGSLRAELKEQNGFFKLATTGGLTRASLLPTSFIKEEMGPIMALKAWYYDSTFRYTMTDNLQTVRPAKRAGPTARWQSEIGQAPLLCAGAWQSFG